MTRRASGFTLLELLVAIAIFGLLATMAYSGLASVLDARAVTEQQADRLQALQRTFLILERDLGQLAPRRVRDDYGDSKPPFASGTDGNQLFVLSRGGWRNPARLPRSNLQRVRYVLRDQALWREYWSVLDRAPETPSRAQRLLDRVRSIRLRYLDNKREWGEQWPPLNAADQATDFPRAVEIEIETDDLGSLRRLFVTAE